MYEKYVEQLLRLYNVSYQKILPMQKGYRNESYPILCDDGSIKNLIIYKGDKDILERIHRSEYVSSYLAQNGFPTRIRQHEKIISLKSDNTQTYAALYNYLPGETLSWEAYTKVHIKLLGKTMSDMHSELQAVDTTKVKHTIVHELTTLFEYMDGYFHDQAVEKALAAKLKLGINKPKLHFLKNLLPHLARLPDQQMLHMDFVRGNILFDTKDGDRFISGILDFEKTATGHPLFDIARTLAFLLVDCKYKNEYQVRKYFLYSGYDKRGSKRLPRVTIVHEHKTHELLKVLTDVFLLYDFYKFLQHNPYEALSENEHFIRTRDLLIENNMVYYV